MLKKHIRSIYHNHPFFQPIMKKIYHNPVKNKYQKYKYIKSLCKIKTHDIPDNYSFFQNKFGNEKTGMSHHNIFFSENFEINIKQIKKQLRKISYGKVDRSTSCFIQGITALRNLEKYIFPQKIDVLLLAYGYGTYFPQFLALNGYEVDTTSIDVQNNNMNKHVNLNGRYTYIQMNAMDLYNKLKEKRFDIIISSRAGVEIFKRDDFISIYDQAKQLLKKPGLLLIPAKGVDIKSSKNTYHKDPNSNINPQYFTDIGNFMIGGNDYGFYYPEKQEIDSIIYNLFLDDLFQFIRKYKAEPFYEKIETNPDKKQTFLEMVEYLSECYNKVTLHDLNEARLFGIDYIVNEQIQVFDFRSTLIYINQ